MISPQRVPGFLDDHGETPDSGWTQMGLDWTRSRSPGPAAVSEKPCAESERTQRWRRCLANLLFFTVLLSHHLWCSAEGKLAGHCHGQGDQESKRRSPNSSREFDFHSPWPKERSDPSWTNVLGGRNASPVRNFISKLTFVNGSTSGRPRSRAGSGFNPHSLTAKFFCNFSTLSHCPAGPREPLDRGCPIHLLLRVDSETRAQYQQFVLVLDKYQQPESYSVQACLPRCKLAYKAWLCSYMWHDLPNECHPPISCPHLCWDVQSSCPYLPPDSKDRMVYGGLSSFICTDPHEGDGQVAPDADCCDVRWTSSRSTSPWSQTTISLATNPQPTPSHSLTSLAHRLRPWPPGLTSLLAVLSSRL
uniref:NALCN channel auxiliary factor 2-like n=1 Tax=Myxine glutinosa TaxID=7769 RepID=UPI00358EC8BC